MNHRTTVIAAIGLSSFFCAPQTTQPVSVMSSSNSFNEQAQKQDDYYTQYEHYLTDQGYKLANATAWTDASFIKGFSLIFKNANDNQIEQNYGDTEGQPTEEINFNKKVVKVRTNDYLDHKCIQFELEDGTKSSLGQCSQTISINYDISVCQNLIGMTCSFESSSQNPKKLAACVIFDDFANFNYQITAQSYEQSIIALDPGQYLPVTNFQTSGSGIPCSSESISVSYKKDSVIKQPYEIPFLSFSSSWKQFSVTTIPQMTDIGVYEIKITASLPRIIYQGDQITRERIFTLTVVDPCTTTPYINDQLRDMQITQGFTDIQNVYIVYICHPPQFLKDYPSGSGELTSCGNQPFLTKVEGKDYCLLQSTNNDHIGDHEITLTYTFSAGGFSSSTLERVINVKILCGTTGLRFIHQTFQTQTIKVGIDPFPITLNVLTSQVSYCTAQVQFYLYTSPNPLSYISLITTGNNSATITIQTIPLGTFGTYTVSLQAEEDAQRIYQNWQVILQDPCQTASFQPDNPLNDMDVTIGVDNSKTMPFIISTDVEKQNSLIVCPQTVMLTSTKNFISLASDNSQIIVNSASVQIPSDLGLHTFTLRVQQSAYSSIFKEYSFQVQIVCMISRIQIDVPLNISHNCHPRSAYAPTTTQVVDVLPSHACGALETLLMTVAPNLPIISFSGSDMKVDSTVIQYLGDNNLIVSYKIPTTSTVIGREETKAVKLHIYWDLCTNATVLKSNLTFTTLTYKFGLPAVVQQFSPFSDDAQKYNVLEQCGPKKYTIEPEHPFISIVPPQGNEFVDDWSISIKSNIKLEKGNYPVKLISTLPGYPQSVPAAYDFIVEMVDTCLTTSVKKAPSLKAMTTIVKNPPVFQSFDQLTDTSALFAEIPSLCGDRQYKILDSPPFIKLVVPDNPWSKPFVIELQTNDPNKAGNYTVSIETTLIDYPSIRPALSSFPVEISPNRLPYFVTKLESTIFIQMTNATEVWTLELPQATDDDGDKISILTDFGAASFVLVKGNFIEIEDISVTGTIRSGMYFLKFILSDGKDERTYSQLLLVNPVPEKQQKQTQPAEDVCDATIQVPSYDKKVKYSSGSNALSVKWDQFELKGPECIKNLTLTVKIIALWADTRIKMASDWVTYTETSISSSNNESYVLVKTKVFYDTPIVTTLTIQASVDGRKDIEASFSTEVVINPQQRKQSKDLVSPPVMSIESLSEKGLLRLAFKEPIMTYESPQDDFFKTPLQFLAIEVIKNSQSKVQDLQEYKESGRILSVEVKQFTSRIIEIQLALSNPLYISYDPFNSDKLLATIIDPQKFVSAEDLTTTAVAMSFATIEMPKQISQEMAATTTLIESNQKILVNSLSTSSLTLNILLGLSLKYLWGMINVLQFVIYMKDWRLNWPSNASLAVKTLRTIALAEFIDFKKMGGKVLAFYGYKPQFKPQRQLQGLLSKEKQRLLLTAIIVIIVVIVVIPLLVLIYRNFRRIRNYTRKQVANIKKQVFWNGLIRFYLQGFLKFGIQTFTFYFGLKRANIKQVASILGLMFFTLASVILFVAAPYMIYKTLKRNQHELFLTQNKTKFGSLYLGVRIREFSTIINVFNFLTLRFLFVVLTFAMESVPGILVNVYMLLNNFNIIYVGWYQPYDTWAQNRIELANSFLLNIVAYNLLLLANLLPNPEAEYKLGWSIIATIGLIFCLNMGYMMGLTLKEFFRKICLIIKKRRERQRLLKEKTALSQSAQTVQQTNLVEPKLRAQNVHSNAHMLANVTGHTVEERQNVERELEEISSLNESQLQQDLYVLPSKIRKQNMIKNKTIKQTKNFKDNFLRANRYVRPSKYEERQQIYDRDEVLQTISEIQDSVFVPSVESEVQRPQEQQILVDRKAMPSIKDSPQVIYDQKDSVFVPSVESEVPQPKLKSSLSVLQQKCDIEQLRFDDEFDQVFLYNEAPAKIAIPQSNDSVFVPSVPSEENSIPYKAVQDPVRFDDHEYVRARHQTSPLDQQPSNYIDYLYSQRPSQLKQLQDQKNQRRRELLKNYARDYFIQF